MKQPIYKKWWFWLLIVIILFIAISPNEKDKKKTIGKVTPEEYAKLENGMSYEKIQEIVGGVAETEDISESDKSFAEYTFPGENGKEVDASVRIIVTTKGLDYKSEDGLLTTYKEKEKAEKAEKGRVEAENAKAKAAKEAELEKERKKPINAEEFESYASNMAGGTFIKSVVLEGNKAHIVFYQSYDEYKNANPQSKVTVGDYSYYFETGEAIQKLFVGENVRLLREYPSLDTVTMVLTFDGKTYIAQIHREEVNDYLGFKVEELNVEDGSWKEKFVNEYMYSDKREEMFKLFVQVK